MVGFSRIWSEFFGQGLAAGLATASDAAGAWVRGDCKGDLPPTRLRSGSVLACPMGEADARRALTRSLGRRDACPTLGYAYVHIIRTRLLVERRQFRTKVLKKQHFNEY